MRGPQLGHAPQGEDAGHGPRGGHGPHGPSTWHGPPGWHGEEHVPGRGADWHAPAWLTLWAPVLMAFLVQVPFAFWAARAAHLEPRDLAVTVLIAAIGPLALIGARRFPGPVMGIVAAAAALDLFVTPQGGPPYIALAFAIVSAIVRRARIWAWVSVAVGWVASLSVALAMGRDDWTPLRIAGTTLGILIVFGVGETIRGRRDQAAQFRRLAGERRQSVAQAERVRIARELHDVLAHSLSQINVQAGVGLHLMERQPEQAAAALASIKETSKTALDEVRAVLGVLRADEGGDPSAPLVPEPDLCRLPALVAAVPGVEVRLDDRLADVPQATQLAFYRIVQESLTNITRHANARSATVRLWRAGGDYRLEVRDDGAGETAPSSESGGRGLLGMRERAELLGGRLTAGPAEGGGFLASVTVPVDASAGEES
jgi:signal transduction histidine kinase